MVYGRQAVELDAMPQLVPSAGFTPPCDYSAFAADSFDLSLLPGGETELPLSPSTQLYTQSPPPSSQGLEKPKIYTTFYPTSPEDFSNNDIELGPDFQKLLAPEDDRESFAKSPNHLDVPSNSLYPSSPSSLSYCSSPEHQIYQHSLISPQYPSSPETFNLYPSSPGDHSTYPQLGTPIYNLYPNSPLSNQFIKTEDSSSNSYQIKEEGFLSPCSVESPQSCTSYSNHSSPNDNQILSDVFLDNSFLEKQIKQESTVDFGELLQNLSSLKEILDDDYKKPEIQNSEPDEKPKDQDHQLLRQVLKDTSFQKKYNLRPFDFGVATGFLHGSIKMEEPEVEDDLISREKIEPVISLAMEQMRKDVSNTCSALGISQDPSLWSSDHVKAWIQWTVQQFGLTPVEPNLFEMTGTELSALTEEEFTSRASQNNGSILYAQLEIWKATYLEDDLSMQWTPTTTNSSPAEMSEDDDEETSNQSTSGTKPVGARSSGGSHIHLWQFLKELLASPAVHGSCIRWLDREKGVFKIEDSVRVAKLWGKRKNRPAMNYDKLSRSIRQYYKKGIMKKTERSQRLVYQFCHPYSL